EPRLLNALALRAGRDPRDLEHSRGRGLRGRVQRIRMQPTDVHVELRSADKRFGAINALQGISLTIKRGEIHALVGENGAGKSTLGRLVAGAHQLDGGQLIVD